MDPKERKERLGWVLKAMRKLDDEFTVDTCDAVAESGLDFFFINLRRELLAAIDATQKEVT